MSSAVRPPKFLPPAAVEAEKLRLKKNLDEANAAAKVPLHDTLGLLWSLLCSVPDSSVYISRQQARRQR